MTRAWWKYFEDDLPYPGYTPDGPTQFQVDIDACRRMGFDPLAITCRCGRTADQTKIYQCTTDRWRPAEYFCALCAPDELRSIL